VSTLLLPLLQLTSFDLLLCCNAVFSAIQTATRAGIPSSRYDALRRDIVQTYGYACVHDIGALEAAVSAAHVTAYIASMTLSSPFHNGD
jgi:hypothetical protein